MAGRRRDRYAPWIRRPESESADRAQRATVLRPCVRVSRPQRRHREAYVVGRDGLCLFAKHLERGRFIWPQATEGTVCLTRTLFVDLTRRRRLASSVEDLDAGDRGLRDILFDGRTIDPCLFA
jgi:hypothetical protein